MKRIAMIAATAVVLVAGCSSSTPQAASLSSSGGASFSVPCTLPDGTTVVLTDYHQGWAHTEGLDCPASTEAKVTGEPNAEQMGAVGAYGTDLTSMVPGMSDANYALYLAFRTCADATADAKYGPNGVGPITDSHVRDIRAAKAMCPDHKFAPLWDQWLAGK